MHCVKKCPFSIYFSPAKFPIWAKYHSQVRSKSVGSYISMSSSANRKSAINLRKFLLSPGFFFMFLSLQWLFTAANLRTLFHIQHFTPYLRIYLSCETNQRAVQHLHQQHLADQDSCMLATRHSTSIICGNRVHFTTWIQRVQNSKDRKTYIGN